jgi:2-polyprenyl-3-methyl-5-hydroxy-6-metoxy-1,4-benzoquinol methylase
VSVRSDSADMDVAELERSGRRFAFGKNWQSFSATVDESRIAEAQASVERLVGRRDLRGVRFLDVGCGSGLFSLAAQRLGAEVTAFDFDPDSVACTRAMLARFGGGGGARVEQGSILDPALVEKLGTFDVVYSWGVLHHTGRMALAFEHVRRLVAPGGTLVIAIYNDQGWISGYWTLVKRLYNTGPLGRAIAITTHLPYLAAIYAMGIVRRRSAGRGMRQWHDFLDWLGGFPFEVATPEAVVGEFRRHGFEGSAVQTCGRRHGCNEFVFVRGSAAPRGEG